MPDTLHHLGDPTDYTLAAGTRLKDGITFMLSGNPLGDFSAEPLGFIGRDTEGIVPFGIGTGQVRTDAGRADAVGLNSSLNSMAMIELPEVISGDFILWFTMNRTNSTSSPIMLVGLTNQNYQYDVNGPSSFRSLLQDVRGAANNICISDTSASVRSTCVVINGSPTTGATQTIADGVTGYMSIARVGTTITFKQYPTAADRLADTNVVWTDVLTGPSADMPYLFYLSTFNALNTRTWNGWTDDFQFMGGTFITTTPFVTGPVLNIADTLAAAAALAIEESTPAGSSIQHEYNIDGGGFQTAGTPVADGTSNIAAVAAALADEEITATIQLRHGLISATGVVSPTVTIAPSFLLGTIPGGGGADDKLIGGTLGGF